MFGSFKAYSPSYELHRAEGVSKGPRLGLGLGDNKYRLRTESLQKNLEFKPSDTAKDPRIVGPDREERRPFFVL